MPYEEDLAISYHGLGIKKPLITLIVNREFANKFIKQKDMETPYLGTFVIGDAADLKIGPYMVSLRFWDKDEEDRRKEWDEYKAERGSYLEQLEHERYSLEEEDFKRWKESRNK